MSFRDYILSANRRNERPVEPLLHNLFLAAGGQNIQLETEIPHRSDLPLDPFEQDHFDAQFRSTGRSVVKGNMIETRIINDFPVIVHHRVTGTINKKEAIVGSADALAVVQKIVSLGKRPHLIIDFRGYIFKNLESHRAWASGFKQNKSISENVNKVAVVGDSGPKLDAEKKMMDTDILRFFSQFNDAYEWLRSQYLGV